MGEDVKQRALRGAFFVIAGYGMSQAIRLGGNLILTRLLVPELFGIMALARAVITGLHFFSDIGLGPAIIRSPRSNDPLFLNTAWTLQVGRGFGLWGLTLLLALPMARIYDSPDLAWIMPVLGLNAVFYGFSATALHTLSKEIRLGKLSLVELASQFLSLLAMILLASLYRNIWALVLGSMIGSLAAAIWSHFLTPEARNRFAFEKEAVAELMGFGKWIFVSTAMMFLATQADRFLLGKLFPLALFGVYSIAVIFAELPKQVISQMSNKVIYPLIAKFSHLPRPELRERILQKRLLLLLPLALLVGLFASFGDVIIDLLYDERYAEAGWMLSLLALGMWPLVLYATIDRSLYAVGKPNYPALGNLLKFIYMLVAVPLLFRQAGFPGAVLAVALNDLPVYLVVGIGLRREQLSCFRQDALATAALAALVALFLAVRLSCGMGLPGR